jgi:hypothetical protein
MSVPARPASPPLPVVALVTATKTDDDDFDMPPLVAALEGLGVAPRVLAWDDPAADFSTARLTVLRSPWNYVHKCDAFLAWCGRTARVTRLWNPLPVVTWNSHKSYLLELADRGIPIAPTRLVRRGRPLDAAELPRLIAEWGRVVVKPAVSAGSFATIQVGADELTAGLGHLEEQLPARDMLLQRFIPAVGTSGERSLVWFDGAFSHAIRKSPRWAGDTEIVSAAVPIADDERALAERVLALVPSPILYARVDLLRDDAGAPLLMELEVIEPSLFFAQAPGSVERFAAALARLATN